MKTNRIPYLNYLGINWYAIFKITPIIFILLVFESCKKEEITIDISPIVHGWEVISMTTPETGIVQNAPYTYIVEFMNDRTYSIDFDRYYCGAKFEAPGNGMIYIEPLVDYSCSMTQYAKDLQGMLKSSTSYEVNGDSLLLSGNGKIKLIRTLGCTRGGATGDGTIGCKKNLVYIFMSIKRSDESVVALTSAKLVRLSDSKIISSSIFPPRQPDWPTSGYLGYLLIDDSHRKEFAGKKIDVEYQGFIDDTMIVKSTFTITADCCHVSLVSGNLDIVIN